MCGRLKIDGFLTPPTKFLFHSTKIDEFLRHKRAKTHKMDEYIYFSK